jgi:hypothetical protein
MKLLYGTTTALVVTISDLYYGSVFRLYLADDFNASSTNPPSSDPFQMFLDFRQIFIRNDHNNPKVIMHRAAVRRGIRLRLAGDPAGRQNAGQTVRSMGIHGIQPYLAIVEADTYLNNHYSGAPLSSFQVPPAKAGSPTSVEYLLTNIQGPNLPSPDLHLQKLHP